jgi:hypothetical protein
LPFLFVVPPNESEQQTLFGKRRFKKLCLMPLFIHDSADYLLVSQHLLKASSLIYLSTRVSFRRPQFPKISRVEIEIFLKNSEISRGMQGSFDLPSRGRPKRPGSARPFGISPSDVDPERRPPNAFILFSRSRRRSIESNSPGINNIECTRILARAWKSLPEEERLAFKRLAAEMQTKFKEDNPNYRYKKTVPHRGIPLVAATTPPSDLPIDDLPSPFRWDMMLNHHDEPENKMTRYII